MTEDEAKKLVDEVHSRVPAVMAMADGPATSVKVDYGGNRYPVTISAHDGQAIAIVWTAAADSRLVRKAALAAPPEGMRHIRGASASLRGFRWTFGNAPRTVKGPAFAKTI